MDIKKFFQTNSFKIIIAVIAGLIVILLILSLGMFIGYRKARFSYRWGENYHQNFGGPRGGFFQDFSGRDFIESHGIFGQIIKIDSASLAIKGRDGAEKIIMLKANTAIRSGREEIKPGDLKVNDYVTVIGDPNDAGQIEANLIRVMPGMPSVAPVK